MTALKPIENRRVRGVKAGRYPLNDRCAHPECLEPTADGHHIFPRSSIGNSLWFVEILDDEVGEAVVYPFAHVTGLCRVHHDDVEEHRAWIKLEDGSFVWYDRRLWESEEPDAWEHVGPLNPQPGSREGKPKRRKLSGEARRTRVNITVRVPADTENGAGIWDDTLERVKERLVVMGLYESDAQIPNYEAAIAAWTDWLNG